MERTKLTSWEKETIISFNEDEKEAQIYTHNPAMIRRVDELCKKHPNEFVLLGEDEKFGSKTYRFPKKQITIRSIQKKSEEERKVLAERLKKAREVQTET